MRKKILGIVFVLFLAITLVACGDKTGNGGGNNGGNDNGNGDNGNGDNNNGGGNQGDPTEIVIMHGAVHEIDPFNDSYSGNEQAARRQLHDKVEKDLNVKIVYKPYPSEAQWGQQRVNSIIDWHLADKAEADIYWITSQWLAEISKSEAIKEIPLSWYNTYGKNISSKFLDATEIQGKYYGFGPDTIYGERALFYNSALLKQWELEDPAKLWQSGDWTWDKFEELARAAGARTEENQYVLGSVSSKYVENMIPSNGGHMVDLNLQRAGNYKIGFLDNPAIEVYNLFERLWSLDLFEPNGVYDAGSIGWQSGNILFHPGDLWFVNADNRWAGFDFVKSGNLGVVPFPLPEGKTKADYKQPSGQNAIYTIASNPKDRDKEELSFEVWNRLQLWNSEEEMANNFEDRLKRAFEDEIYVEVFMDIYDKSYFDIFADLNVASTHVGMAWQTQVVHGIKDGTTRNKIEAIMSIYEEALKNFFE